MRKINLIIISILVLLSNFFFLSLQSKIFNTIIVKVGDDLITSVDIQNEITTNLVIGKLEVTQENIDNNKKYAIKNLINKSIKKNEINKYKVKEYSKKDLENYIENISKKLNTDKKGLKNIFQQSGINYQSFIEKYEIELLWNTLIFELYKNQTNVNIIEVENDVEKIKEKTSGEEIKKIRKNILNIKKKEKLDLFSRSHFSNLENTVAINFP